MCYISTFFLSLFSGRSGGAKSPKVVFPKRSRDPASVRASTEAVRGLRAEIALDHANFPANRWSYRLVNRLPLARGRGRCVAMADPTHFCHSEVCTRDITRNHGRHCKSRLPNSSRRNKSNKPKFTKNRRLFPTKNEIHRGVTQKHNLPFRPS